jgi:hypothetical protein
VTRYLVGSRAHGDRPATLAVTVKPPTFYQPSDGPERIHWEADDHTFHPKRGLVGEWRDDRGRTVIARVFPEAFDGPLSEHDSAVAEAEQRLRNARRARQEFLDMVAAHAKPVRVEDARRHREDWPNTEAGKAEAEQRKAELAKSQEHLAKLNAMMGSFIGGTARRR